MTSCRAMLAAVLRSPASAPSMIATGMARNAWALSATKTPRTAAPGPQLEYGNGGGRTPLDRHCG